MFFDEYSYKITANGIAVFEDSAIRYNLPLYTTQLPSMKIIEVYSVWMMTMLDIETFVTFVLTPTLFHDSLLTLIRPNQMYFRA